MLGERRTWFWAGLALAVGEDIETLCHQFGEQLRRPLPTVENDRRAGVGADERPYLLCGSFQLAGQAGAWFCAPDEHTLAGPVAHPGVDLGRRRQPGARQVCLGQASFAVVGTDVAVDVERPGGTGGGVEVSFCQRPQQICRTTLSCQFFHATPQRGDLGRPVEADEAPYVSGAKAAAQPLGAHFAGKVAEHHGERERAQRVKSGTGGTVDLGERVEQPGRHERRQD